MSRLKDSVLRSMDKNVERVDLSRRPYSVWVEGEE